MVEYPPHWWEAEVSGKGTADNVAIVSGRCIEQCGESKGFGVGCAVLVRFLLHYFLSLKPCQICLNWFVLQFPLLSNGGTSPYFTGPS